MLGNKLSRFGENTFCTELAIFGKKNPRPHFQRIKQYSVILVVNKSNEKTRNENEWILLTSINVCVVKAKYSLFLCAIVLHYPKTEHINEPQCYTEFNHNEHGHCGLY